MKPISLVHKYDSGSLCGCPVSTSKEPYEDVPHAHLQGEKALASLPEEGTITFKFKRKEVSVRRDGERPVSLTLELREIVNVAESEVETKEESSADALDKLRDELEDE